MNTPENASIGDLCGVIDRRRPWSKVESQRAKWETELGTRGSSTSFWWHLLRRGTRYGGGMTYDALIGACARKMKAEVIYSWNIAHLLRLGEEVAERVRTP